MLWLLAAILALGLAGAATLLIGLRGRRIDTHPICRRCGFDLIGQAPSASHPSGAPAVPSPKGPAPVAASPGPEGLAGVATGQPAEPAQPVESRPEYETPQRGPRSAESSHALANDNSHANTPVCSECGADLTRRRAIRIGQRRRRPAFATLGAIALLVALAATGAIGWAAATKYDWNTIKPLWLLASELQSLDPAVAKAATDELRNRLSGSDIAPMRGDRRDTRAAERLARRILAYQADTQRPWNHGAGEVFERMWQMNLLPEEMIHRYVAQSSPVNVRVRARIEQGEPLAVRFDVGQRAGYGGMVAMRAALVDMTLGGKRVPVGSYQFSLLQGWPDSPWNAVLVEPTVRFELLETADFAFGFKSRRPPALDSEPGRWPLRLRLVVRRHIHDPDRQVYGRHINRSPFALPPSGDSLADLARHAGLWYGKALPEAHPDLELIEIETEIEIIQPGDAVVKAATGADAELVAKRIIESALLEPTTSRPSRSGSLQLRLTLSKDLPLDIAYDVALILPTGRRHLGSLVHDVGETPYGWIPLIPLGPTPDVQPGDTLRFIFTPNPHAAARLAGIEQIAGEPFEVELIVPEPPQVINGH